MKANVGTITPEAARAELEYLYQAGAQSERMLAQKQRPEIFKVGEDTYISINGKYELLKPSLPDRIIKPETFETYSLAGLAQYIKADVDGFFSATADKHLVRVTGPGLVEVISPTRGYHKERVTVARCQAVVPHMRLGEYMDPDEFQIMLQTCFQESENRAIVLKLAGSLRKEQNMQTADDGVSQKVTVNAGVATAADVIVKNPVTLTPWRTFREVEQPESPFVLRFNEEAKAALFTGDRAGWQMEAVKTVGDWLRKELDGCNVEVIA